MNTTLIWQLVLQVVLIGLNAVFACAEIAVISVKDVRLEQLIREGNKSAEKLKKLTEMPERFLSTIQIAITLSGYLGSAAAATNFAGLITNAVVSLGVGINPSIINSVAVVLVTLILSYFTLVFGELVPKRLAMKNPEGVSLKLAGMLYAISKVFKPIVSLLSVSVNGVLRLPGVDPNSEDDEYSEEEIRMMVDGGGEKGTIDHQEKEFIQNVFEFNDIMVGNIATHRTDVVVLWLEDSDDPWAKTLYENRHTLYPVCDGSPDKIVGILNSKDYFRLADRSREKVLAAAVHPAYFVPETIKADLLFRNMKKTRNSLAVVMDEYGGMVGIVTLFDLIEELVGDLNEEPEDQLNPEPYIEKLDTGLWKLVGNVPLKDIHEATGLELCSEDYDTFTGFVFDALGTIPDNGEHDIDLELKGMKIHISSIVDHQVDLATIAVSQEESPTGE